MKLLSHIHEFPLLFWLSLFTTAIVFSSCSKLPVPASEAVGQENQPDGNNFISTKKGSSSDENNIDDESSLTTTPNSDDPDISAEQNLNGDSPSAIQYGEQSQSQEENISQSPSGDATPPTGQYFDKGGQQPPSLDSLAPAINPFNADNMETANAFFLPIISFGGGYGRGWGGGYGGGWGRGWRGGWGGGRWGGGGWGGRWGGGGWGGRWGGGGGRWGGGWRG